MNVENIRKVRDLIAGLSDDRFNMSTWAAQNHCPVSPTRLLHDCGTCGCIGGWTNAMFSRGRSVGEAARDLGLDPERADALFYPPGFDDGQHTAAHAVAVLDHLIETGKVDWRVADQVASA